MKNRKLNPGLLVVLCWYYFPISNLFYWSLTLSFALFSQSLYHTHTPKLICPHKHSHFVLYCLFSSPSFPSYLSSPFFLSRLFPTFKLLSLLSNSSTPALPLFVDKKKTCCGWCCCCGCGCSWLTFNSEIRMIFLSKQIGFPNKFWKNSINSLCLKKKKLLPR